MVADNTDPEVVTARILRETRAAAKVAAEEEAAKAAVMVAEDSPAATQGELVVVQPEPVGAPPPDAETAFRHARLGVVAALVLLLFWAWLRSRADRFKIRPTP